MGHYFCVGLISIWVTAFVWALYSHGSLLLCGSYIHMGHCFCMGLAFIWVTAFVRVTTFVWALYSYGSYIHMGHYSEYIVHVIAIQY